MTPTPIYERKPRRPKRPLTAYMAFMKKFLRAQCIKSSKEAQTAVKAGAKKWNKMSDAERAKYERGCAKGRMLYLEQKTEYLRQLKAFRAPPRPYAAFLVHYFQEWSRLKSNKRGHTDSGDHFVKINQEALSAWRILPDSEKDKYRNEFYQQYDDFCRRIEEQQRNSGEFIAFNQSKNQNQNQDPTTTTASVSSTPGPGSGTGSASGSQSDPGLFNLRQIRRERCRFLLQQKLERKRKHQEQLQRFSQNSNLNSAKAQKAASASASGRTTRSLILEQESSDGGSNNNNADANNVAGAAGSSNSSEAPESNPNSNNGSTPSSSNSKAKSDREARPIRRRKAEVKDNGPSHGRSSLSSSAKNAKNIKLSSSKNGKNSSHVKVKAKAVGKKMNKHVGVKRANPSRAARHHRR